MTAAALLYWMSKMSEYDMVAPRSMTVRHLNCYVNSPAVKSVDKKVYIAQYNIIL